MSACAHGVCVCVCVWLLLLFLDLSSMVTIFLRPISMGTILCQDLLGPTLVLALSQDHPGQVLIVEVFLALTETKW